MGTARRATTITARTWNGTARATGGGTISTRSAERKTPNTIGAGW